MSSIKLDQVSLSYPLLGAYGRSLKQSALQIFASDRQTGPEHFKIKYVEALKNINLELHSGDRLGLIGRNGAGKSTLLKVLAGIYMPSRGTIKIQGNISPLLGLSIGMNPLATGYENIKLRCLLHGFDKKKIQAVYREVEEFTELGHFLSMPIKTYSSGMNVRLNFGIATAITPDILILDEIVGAGDTHFIQKAQARLHGLIESSNILILASHSDEILRKFCNKILWLDQGRVVCLANQPIETVLTEYKKMGAKALP